MGSKIDRKVGKVNRKMQLQKGENQEEEEEEEDKKEQPNIDPWTLHLYAMKSPATQEKYTG